MRSLVTEILYKLKQIVLIRDAHDAVDVEHVYLACISYDEDLVKDFISEFWDVFIHINLSLLLTFLLGFSSRGSLHTQHAEGVGGNRTERWALAARLTS